MASAFVGLFLASGMLAVGTSDAPARSAADVLDAAADRPETVVDGELVPLRGASSVQLLRDRLLAPLAVTAPSAPSVLYSAGPGMNVSERPALEGIAVETVIVTSDALAPSFQRLVDWKNRSGTLTTLRTVEWIRDEYPGEVDTQASVRAFLQDAYHYWGIRSVILGGGDEHVPIRQARDYSWNGLAGGTEIATDYYYACLDGTWNANGNDRYGEPPIPSYDIPTDLADVVPELEVGRIPCADIAEAEQYLDDYFRYLFDPAPGYLDRMMAFGEVLFERDWQIGDCDDCSDCPGFGPCASDDGAEHCIEVIEALQGSAIGSRINATELYERDYWWIPRGRPNAEPLGYARWVSEFARGVNVVYGAGHGDIGQWDLGPDQAFASELRVPAGSDLRRASPGLCYVAQSAFTSDIERNSMSEALMFGRRVGALNVISSSNLDFPSSVRRMTREFFSAWPGDGTFDPGDAFFRAQTLSGERVTEIRSPDRFVLFGLAYHGDPDFRPWMGDPGVLAVTAPSEIPLGATQVPVHVESDEGPVAGARVALYKEGDAVAVGLTGENGDVVLPFQTGTLGTYFVTVVHLDALPFRGVGNVVSAGTAFLDLDDVSIDDTADPDAGIVGNGNGQIEVGETVGIDLTLTNTGVVASEAGEAHLSIDDISDDLQLELVSGASALGPVAPGETIRLPRAFLVRFEDNSPDGGTSLPDRGHAELGIGLTFGAETASYSRSVFAHRPTLILYATHLTEVYGNGNDLPEAGEVFDIVFEFLDDGPGGADGLVAELVALDPNSLEVSDSPGLLESITPGDHGQTTAFRLSFRLVHGHEMTLTLRDPRTGAVRFERTFGLDRPAAPEFLAVEPASHDISFLWSRSDASIAGFRLLRASTSGRDDGPFVPLGTGWIPAASDDAEEGHYVDVSLPENSDFLYQLVAVGGNGLESPGSAVEHVSTPPSELAGWPVLVASNHSSFGPPLLADLDSDGRLEAVVGGDVLHAFRADGTGYAEPNGDGRLPDLGLGEYLKKPAAADLIPSGDGRLEIAAVTEYRRLLVMGDRGELLWNHQLNQSGGPPAIGNIDSDPGLEVVALAGGSLFAFHGDGTTVGDAPALTSFPAVYPWSGICLANVDDDLELEMLFTTNSSEPNDATFQAINGDGTSVEGFPFRYADYAAGDHRSGATPAAADVSPRNPNGSSSEPLPELFMTTADHIWLIDPDAPGGFGWSRTIDPMSYDRVSSPALGDVDRDGRTEVVVGGASGHLYVLDAETGEPHPMFRTEPYDYLQLDSAAALDSPVLADLDGDSRPEILVADRDGWGFVVPGDGGTPRRWLWDPLALSFAASDLDANGSQNLVVLSLGRKQLSTYDLGPGTSHPRDPLSLPWPQVHANARNSGLLMQRSAGFVDVHASRDASLDAIDAIPARFALHKPAPNPSMSSSSVQLPLDLPAPAHVDLTLHSPDGRRVATVVSGWMSAGRHVLAWQWGDGARIPPGVYFLRVDAGDVGRATRKITKLE